MSDYSEPSVSNLWPLRLGYRCSLYPPTWISVFLGFSFHWVWLWIELFEVGLWVFRSCDQRSAICLSSWHLGHSGCQTLSRVSGCTFSCRNQNLPLKYNQLVLLPFFQHSRFTFVEQDWADQGLVNGEFCLAWKVARLQMFAQSEEAPICFVAFPDSRHSLASSGILDTQILWRFQSVCRQLPRFAPRHESSYHFRPQSYILSCIWICKAGFIRFRLGFVEFYPNLSTIK
jgi:hypothetical protein